MYFSGVLHHFVSAKLANSSIRVKSIESMKGILGRYTFAYPMRVGRTGRIRNGFGFLAILQ